MIKLATDEACSPSEAWSIYTALTLHFNPERDYDALKYNFKGPKCSREKFMAHKHRYFFEKIVKDYKTRNTIIEYFLGNIIQGKQWINEYNDEAYQQWLAKIQALTYNFKTDISALAEAADPDNLSFDECIIPSNKSELPLIYKLYKEESISLETLACLNFMINFVDRLNKELNDPLDLAHNISHKIKRYGPLLASNMNIEKNTQAIISSFTF